MYFICCVIRDALIGVILAEEEKEVTRSEVKSLRLAIGEETFEKDTLQQSCTDLRTQVKRLDAEKAELNRIIQDSKHKLSGIGFIIIYTAFRKKHPFTFSFISPWKMFRFIQNFLGMFMRN